MYAVMKAGGKQFKVSQDDILRIEKCDAEVGTIIVNDTVLAVGDNDNLSLGTPTVDGASVALEVLAQRRARKVVIFKKRRRKSSQRKRGHRQHYTMVRVLELLTNNAKPSREPQGMPEKVFIPKETQDDVDDIIENAVGSIEKAVTSTTKEKKDDLSLLSGVGPVLEKRLIEAGITTFKQIADLNEEEIKALDEKADLDGRIEREEWQEQARELMAGKPPRAKVDQKELAKSKADDSQDDKESSEADKE